MGGGSYWRCVPCGADVEFGTKHDCPKKDSVGVAILPGNATDAQVREVQESQRKQAEREPHTTFHGKPNEPIEFPAHLVPKV